jgi:hypothetical protein
MRLYLDGKLVGINTNAQTSYTNNTLPRSLFGRCSFATLPRLAGEMDEVRIWRMARTPEQIRENIARKLAGDEDGLLGLWNFDDPAQPGRDSGPGGHHGRVVGNVALFSEVLPSVVYGLVQDKGGRRLTNATLSIRVSGESERQAKVNASGEFAFTINPTLPCDVFVNSGTLSGYRLGFQIQNKGVQRLDWTLTETQLQPSSTGSTLGNVNSSPPQYFEAQVVTTTLTDSQGGSVFRT